MKRQLLFAVAFVWAFLPQHLAAHDQLHAFQRGSWQAILHAHAGRPTMVNFWGVTCGPCKVELPLLGQFVKDNPGVDVVTVNADLVPNAPEATLSMLAKAGLSSVENWTFSDGFVERLRFEIDPNWQGDIPRTMLIARNGKVTTIEGIADFTDVRKWFGAQAIEAR
ncbi:TlpA disulfide reductase family protein [Nitrobacter sp. NHB1]|uniref:TlpA family protein disulfide reductase n=1 Tax=Nitrobacter sp. NHB1 TaxID=3119830 RepID=UPI002FFD5C3F